MNQDRCILVLGGAGLVGSQIVRALANQVNPERVIIASLFREEVQEFLAVVRQEFPHIEFIGAWGDVFVRSQFTAEQRAALLQNRDHSDSLYQDLFGSLEEAYKQSALVQLIHQYKPDVLIDSINTATAISYQDVESLSKKSYDILQQLRQSLDEQDNTAVANLSHALESSITTLLISQSLPQLIRHVQMIHTAMTEVGTRLYLKIGTTGTGGMGLNIPYTHSEDRPSAKLMSKTAVGFAHTGLLFALSRTPNGPIVKELKPAAMIGYRHIDYKPIRQRGRALSRYQAQTESLDGRLTLQQDESEYQAIELMQMVGIDTGENGFFAKGEYEAITHINQMESITPEEIAQQAVLEVQGGNTGHDVIASLNGSVLDSSYRAGIIRHMALEQLNKLEAETASHSVALGQLGPPELSKLLYEAHLLRLTYQTLTAVLTAAPEEVSQTLYHYLQENESLCSQITSIGVPILTPDGQQIIRGPRLNIPESIYADIELTGEAVDSWAKKGWVDLRPSNFATWQERFQRMLQSQQMPNRRGSAAVSRYFYLSQTIEIGAVVAWVFNNDFAGYRLR